MVTTYDLLRFAHETDQDLYFDPPFEVELMAPIPSDDEQEREYQMLAETDYSFASALAEAAGDEPGPLTRSEFRIPDSTASQYLELMEASEIADRLHDHPAAGREVLVGLGSAGYRTPGDFVSESVDHIDIAKDAGVDRDLVSTIAKDFVGGFSTGSELREAEQGPFSDVQLADTFDGWELRDHDPDDSVVRWVSRGRFNVTVKESDGRFSVVVNTPEDEKHDYYRKGRQVLVDAEDIETRDAVEAAQNWLAEHQIPDRETTALADEEYIGPSTHDYLILEHGVTTPDELEAFVTENPDVASDVFGSDAMDELTGE